MAIPFKMKMKSYGQGKSPIPQLGVAIRQNAAAAGAMAEVPQNPQNPPALAAQGVVNAMPR